MANDFAIVENYLLRNEYPVGMKKGDKANLRRRCRTNFKLEEGILYYQKSTQDGASGSTEWRICVRNESEKQRVMESCHSGMEGQFKLIFYSGSV